MTSAPTSAAYASPPVASPPVTVACDPISGPACRPRSRADPVVSPIAPSETELAESAVDHGDRASGRCLARRADGGDLLAEAVRLLAVHLEAEPHQRLLHLVEVLADQVAGDRHLRRPLGDRHADRRSGRDRGAGGDGLGHDDALRLVALHVGWLKLDVVAGRPMLHRVDVLPA